MVLKIKLVLLIILELIVFYLLKHSHNNKVKELFTNINEENENIEDDDIVEDTCVLQVDNTQKVMDSALFNRKNGGKNVCYTHAKNINNNIKCCPSTVYVNNRVVCRKDFTNMKESDIDDWESECILHSNVNANNGTVIIDKNNKQCDKKPKHNDRDISELYNEVKHKESLIEILNKKMKDVHKNNEISLKRQDTIIKDKLDLENQITILKRELDESRDNINRLESQSAAFVDGMKGYKKFSHATLSTKSKYILDVDKNVNNPDECAELCNTNNQCQSFSFDNSNEICKLYNINSDTIPLNIYGKNIGTVDYYEKNDPIHNYNKYPNKTLNIKTREVEKTEYPLDCSKLCDNKEWCMSFEYNKSKRECHLKDKKMDKDHPVINNATYDFYNVIQKNIREKGDDLVAHWKLDESFGNKIYDNTGHSIHGELVNGTFREAIISEDALPEETASKSRSLIEFNGTSTVIVLPGNKNIDVRKITLSVWVKTDDINRYGYLFEKTTNGYMNTQYSLFISKVNDKTHIIWRTNPLSDTIINDWTQHDLSIPVRENMRNNTWCNIVVVHNGKEKKIYINGELKKKVAYEHKLRANENGISVIGAHAKPFNMYFKGFIRDVRIYKKDVSDEEIKKIYTVR